MSAQTMIPEIRLTDTDLVTWARARIAADIEEIVGIGVRLGLLAAGKRVQPALDLGAGLVFIADPETRSVYALGPARGIVGEDGDGERIEHDA